MLIPTEAVQTAADGTIKSVMVIAADGSAHKRPVLLGIQTATTVQVLSGLTTADTVITTGAYGLDDGTKVKAGTADAGKPDTADKAGAGKKVDQ
jgi:multidrug efflux pump subunit AcrA (membrane-fusion protein)